MSALPRSGRRAVAAFLLNLVVGPSGYVFAGAPRAAAIVLAFSVALGASTWAWTLAHPPGAYAFLFTPLGVLNPAALVLAAALTASLAAHAAWIATRRTPQQRWPRRLAVGLGAWVGWLLLLAVGRAFLPFSTYQIPSASMEPSLHEGDVLNFRGARALCGPRPVARGDVVVYRQRASYYLKRVVGLPGDTVETHGPEVEVNGRSLRLGDAGSARVHATEGPATVPLWREGASPSRAWRVTAQSYPDIPDTPPTRLGADELFVVGDNRGNSLDSRTSGPIRTSQLCGVAVEVLWSAGETPLGPPP